MGSWLFPPDPNRFGQNRRLDQTHVAGRGRELADLILGVESDLTRLPWLSHRCPPWEPEPLRWLGVTSTIARDRRHAPDAAVVIVVGRLA
jgi:hypothetical protein